MAGLCSVPSLDGGVLSGLWPVPSLDGGVLSGLCTAPGLLSWSGVPTGGSAAKAGAAITAIAAATDADLA